jgi:carbonic anhydrase
MLHCKWINCTLLACTAAICSALPSYAGETSGAATLNRLIEGNHRFAVGRLEHPHQSVEQRISLSKTQHPFATVLSCSDSRVPPEILFDTGLGDLFTVRVAGNVVDSTILGSIEYGTEHLSTPVVLVLGHTGCGAVQATLQGDEPHTHIEQLIKDIRPAVRAAAHDKGNLFENAVRDNVVHTVQQLRAAKPILHNSYREGTIRILGAVYHIDSGIVEFLPE